MKEKLALFGAGWLLGFWMIPKLRSIMVFGLMICSYILGLNTNNILNHIKELIL